MHAEGHVAIVTGGGSGLGEASARALARAGAKTALLDVNMDRAETVAAEIGGIAVKCDVSDAGSGEDAVSKVENDLGVPRILINCAGIGTSGKTVSKDGPLSLDVYRRTIEVNLIGSFNMIRLMAARAQALDGLENGERGVIVNTASVAAFDGQIGQAAYSSSKGGIVGMTLPVARDLARSGIRVMTIAPGIFKTPMLMGLPEEVQQSLGASVPFPQRLGEPAEFAALVMHIVENQMLNGEVIRLDGAIRMAPK